MNKSNSMIVKNMVRRHIAESLDATTVEELKQALSDMENQIAINRLPRMSYYEAVDYTLSGLYEGFLFETYKIDEFIKSLDLNKIYTDSMDNWHLYKILIARELPYMEKLSNKKLAELL